MRKVINLQMEFWKKDIANIEFDLQSRDEIPKLLMGLILGDIRAKPA